MSVQWKTDLLNRLKSVAAVVVAQNILQIIGDAVGNPWSDINSGPSRLCGPDCHGNRLKYVT